MPNKANLRRWVRALRSGAYQQGSSYMRTADNKYCCLGVAMDLAIANGVQCTSPDWGQTASVPEAVNAWFGVQGQPHGLNQRLDGLSVEGTVPSPSNLNDHNVPFSVIADRIESTYGLLED